MLGMLASVGATRAQKRQSVLYEAFILGLIGIPFGPDCRLWRNGDYTGFPE